MAEPELKRHESEWNLLGEMDPLWAVLTYPDRKFHGWDEDEFFRTGQHLVSRALETARRLALPRRWDRALDFGCGVGRLTRALSGHFRECVGVDISLSMITAASALNHDLHNCAFLVNDKPDLSMFPSHHFDFVITLIVLQHMPSSRLIFRYLEEAIRVLAPGGLFVFQLPTYISVRRRLQLRRRAYTALSKLGIDHRFLYNRLRLHPMHMKYVPEKAIRMHVESLGAKLLCDISDDLAGAGIASRTYYVSR